MRKTDVKDLLDTTDVQDPTDFPPSSTAPGLRALDSALRLRVTITISRLHLITGAPLQCARSQISVKPACPSCWKETAISSFRINPAMEEAVTAWKDARRFVLCMVNEALKAQTTAPESLRPSKKRKPNSHSVGVISSLASPQRKSGRSDTPSTPKGHLTASTSDDDIEQDVFSGNSNIECPVCAKSVPMRRINDHLDSNCKHYFKSGQKDAWSKLLDGKKVEKRRQQIRDLLAAHDLSTAATGPTHRAWVAPALRKRPTELRTTGVRKEPLKTDITEYRRANKAEFDKLVQLARPKSNGHGEGESSRHLKGPAVASSDTIMVDSDPEG
ncbi:hypothetical protein BJV77DRAFT_978880 [Russula vinacea]|nr:hypothetical protein BJV77DRAFT_978880 [Russula vinacea]